MTICDVVCAVGLTVVHTEITIFSFLYFLLQLSGAEQSLLSQKGLLLMVVLPVEILKQWRLVSKKYSRNLTWNIRFSSSNIWLTCSRMLVFQFSLRQEGTR